LLVAILAAIAIIGIAAAAAVRMGIVHDIGTAGALFSILALPITVLISAIARRISKRVRKARELAMRREDSRDIDYMISALNLCRSLVLGSMERGSTLGYTMSAMHHVADHIGTIKTRHGHLFTDQGKATAEEVRSPAPSSTTGQACAPADLASILDNLDCLRGEILDVDDDAPRERRLRHASAQ